MIESSEIETAKAKLKNLIKEYLQDEKYVAKNYTLFDTATDKPSLLENKDYFLMYDRWQYPEKSKSLWVIARNPDLFLDLDVTLDSLAKKNYIHSTHDLERFQEFNFGNYVERFELDYENLTFFKSLFNSEDPEEKVFYQVFDDWEKELDNYYEQLKKISEISNYVLNFFQKASIVITGDKNNLLNLLEENNNRVGFLRYEGNPAQLTLKELQIVIDDMTRMFFVIKKNDVEKFKHFFGVALGYRLDAVKEYYQTAENCVIGVLFSDVNETNIVTNYESTTFLEKNLPDDHKKLLLPQIEMSAQLAQNLYIDFMNNGDTLLKNHYQKDLQKTYNETYLTLLFAGKVHPLLGLQQDIYIPYRLCLGNYIYNDQLTYGINKKIKQLISSDLSNKLEIVSNEFILREINFMNEHYFVSLNDNLGWEFGIRLEEANKDLLNFYATYKGKTNDLAHTFIQMSLPYFILFLLMHHLQKINDQNDDYFKILETATKIIKEYQLVIPLRYQKILFTTGFFSDEEKDYAINQYQQALDQQLKLRADCREMEANRFRNGKISRIIEHEDYDEVIFEPEESVETEKKESEQLKQYGIFKETPMQHKDQPVPSSDQEKPSPK